MAKRPSPAQLRARAAFAARYGGKRPKARPTRSPMAKKSAKSYARSALGGINTRGLLAGALAGAASGYASKQLGKYGPAAASAAVGLVMKQPVLQVLAGVQLGAAVTQGMPHTATPAGGYL